MTPLALGLVSLTLSGAAMTTPLTGTVKDINSKDFDLGQFNGKVVLVVNVASRCGYTRQYKDLQALYEKYGTDGLVVLGVPSNDFGGQEPGTNEDILKFCQTDYNVKFPLLAKVPVTGSDKCDLYKRLTAADAKFPGEVKWNFEKFLIGRDGQVLGRYSSGVNPMGDEITAAVKKALGQ
jgi:glutathione peroxidase